MKKNDVEQTLNKGLVLNTPYITIFALVKPTNNSQKNLQVAAVVSKKVHPSAVQRHKYQRWIREIVFINQENMPNYAMFVLIAKPNIREITDFAQLQENLSPLLVAQAGRLKNLSKSTP